MTDAAKTLQSRNRKTVYALIGLLMLMGGITAGAAPFYDYFSQATGYAGTTGSAESAPLTKFDRTITVRFNTDVGRRLPWRFEPSQRVVTLLVGEKSKITFIAENLSDETLAGHVISNVTPFKMGSYISQIDCFCFDEQILAPGERVELPVTFFIDPSIMDNVNLDSIKTITLSYSFFKRSMTTPSKPLVQKEADPNTLPAAQEGT